MLRIAVGARPGGQSLFVSRHRGFSLVEVMMSIVLLALSVALAMPSFRDMVEKRQVTNGAEQIAALINSAQGVAVKTNQVVTVSYHRDADDDWCVGATLGATACDCEQTTTTAADYCQITSQPFVINNSHARDRSRYPRLRSGGLSRFTELACGIAGEPGRPAPVQRTR